jgi:outer membrane lipoprotein-sorting protein
MNPLPLRLLAASAAALLWSAAVRAEPAIIEKARAFLGPEDALNGVTSVHMKGTMVRENPADPTHNVTADLEIIVEKPYKFRDGWHRHEEKDAPAKWSQLVAGAGAIRQMRANIWQNLAFYRQIDSSGPTIVDQGSVESHGVVCEKVAFIHDATTSFYRFFDQATGRLVFTTTPSGSEIREEGELHAGGIRFPQRLITTFSGPGKAQVVTLTFTSVTVNEVFPDSVFATPEPRPRAQP